MVVDTDVHHGNGTAHIFRNDDSVFTLSIHQEQNYPAYKPPSNLDLALEDASKTRNISRYFTGSRSSRSMNSIPIFFFMLAGDPLFFCSKTSSAPPSYKVPA